MRVPRSTQQRLPTAGEQIDKIFIEMAAIEDMKAKGYDPFQPPYDPFRPPLREHKEELMKIGGEEMHKIGGKELHKIHSEELPKMKLKPSSGW